MGIFWIIPAAANIWLAWRRPASNSSQCFLPVTSFETPCCLFPLFRLFVASFFFVDSSLPLSSFQTFTNLLYNPHQPSLTSPSPSISPSALFPHYISTPGEIASDLYHMGREHASREKKLPMVIFLIFVQKNVSTIRFQEIKIRPLKDFEKMRFLCFYIIGV